MLIDHIHDQLGRHRVGVISESMPDFIKVAEESIVTEDLSKLADGCFAYSDGVNRYFPIHTPEHTWFSHAYFQKCASEIDERDAQKIQTRIEDACLAFDIPEASLVKVAAHEDEVDALHTLSVELNRFVNNYKSLPPEERRARAKELTRHAKALNRQHSLHDVVHRYSGDHLRHDYHHAFGDRMRHFRLGAPERQTLLSMQNEAKNHIPERIARALSIFDRNAGLDAHYDNGLDDPYTALLTGKEPDADDFEVDGETIPHKHLQGFDWDSLGELLSESTLGSLKSNPLEALSGLEPGIRVIVIRKINHHA
jgi:hypothetical protein